MFGWGWSVVKRETDVIFIKALATLNPGYFLAKTTFPLPTINVCGRLS